MSLPAGFWAKTTTTDCIVWSGAVNNKGYGCYAVGGSSKLAHRVAWEDAHGPIPSGLTIDHLCRVRNCVNVAHMELVSIAENIRRIPRRRDVGDECRNGHPLADPDAVYVSPRGDIECRICRSERQAERNARRKTQSTRPASTPHAPGG